MKRSWLCITVGLIASNTWAANVRVQRMTSDKPRPGIERNGPVETRPHDRTVDLEPATRINTRTHVMPLSSRRVEIIPHRDVRPALRGPRYGGPRFHRTRYYGSRWWRHDTHLARWTFWSQGYWWWTGPGRVLYVYGDGDYYPYDSGRVDVARPLVPQAPPPSSPASTPADNEDQSLKSPDRRREVQIVGPQDEAYLYDLTSGRSTYLNRLGRQVETVRYAGGTQGKPLQILLDFQDGHFELFDANGVLLTDQSAAVTEHSPPAPPSDGLAP